MTYFLVEFLHLDMDDWEKHKNAHLIYLERLIQDKKLILFGTIENYKYREDKELLIFHIKDRHELMKLLEIDPYWYEDIVGYHHINKWRPIFDSSQNENLLFKK